MKAFFGSLVILMISYSAMANFNLAKNGKSVFCYADDNQSWLLSANRTTIKYTVEGESLGPKKITKIKSDNSSFVSYLTSEGILTLSNKGDSYRFNGETEAGQIECE